MLRQMYCVLPSFLAFARSEAKELRACATVRLSLPEQVLSPSRCFLPQYSQNWAESGMVSQQAGQRLVVYSPGLPVTTTPKGA